jgi:protein-L-isoaspartate(D-aspartate) O-methyltransferase
VRDFEVQGIDDTSVLRAIQEVPRHELVPRAQRHAAYENRPLPIGKGQTISQPYIVALMTQLAQIEADDRVLEVGTGSGYQAAILAKLAAEVYTIEIVEALGERARADLTRLGLASNVHFRIGNGYRGWPDAAPFDAIVVTAAPVEVPAPLKEQLAVGGRLVVPVGDLYQELQVIERTKSGFERHESIPVRFVPMTGAASGS